MNAPSSTAACVLIASESTTAAEQAALRAGLTPGLVIGKHECAGSLRAIRHQARALGIRTVAIHSADWERQSLPYLFELAALRLGLDDCRIVVGDGSSVLPISRRRLARSAARMPLEAGEALATVGAELSRFERARRRPTQTPRADAGRDAVIGIWPGAGALVGGHVTHMSGVLAAFADLGLRVGLVTLGPPPHQLEEAADEIEIARPLPHAARLTGETSRVCVNRVVRAAGARLLERLRPRLVYQRHEAFVTFGVDIARAAGAPLVLEWNNSEAWAHRHWHVASPAKRVFTPLATRMERFTLERSSVIAAVSDHSAQMALEEGAAADSVLILPNGVDIEAIDRGRAAADGTPRSSGALIGWVGSFDPWHGAEVLVRAMAMLPEDIRALLIGDGAQRSACEALARELGVASRIEWTGWLAHAQAVGRLAGCDVVVSPHVQMEDRPFFGSPTKIFEYMALDVPIVASDLEQIGELLTNEKTAMLVRPGDAADLARGIRAVIELPDRGRGLAAEARREAENDHTWEARVRVILDKLEGGHGARGVAAMDRVQLSRTD